MPVRILYNNTTQMGDLRRDGVNLLEDDGLESAIHISLFTARRADPGDQIPDGAEVRGWWGDVHDEKGRLIGSKLWLLAGAKLPPQRIIQAGEYAREALLWMVEDGIADEVTAVAQRLDHGALGLIIRIHRPAEPSDRWESFWVAVNLATLTGT